MRDRIDVAPGIACGARCEGDVVGGLAANRQVDEDAGGDRAGAEGRIVDDIAPAAAVDDVGAGIAAERIGAVGALDGIGAQATIGTVEAGHRIVDAAMHRVADIGAADAAGPEVDDDAARALVAIGVVATAAGNGLGAGAGDDEGVVAAAADQRVVAAVRGQNGMDIDQGVGAALPVTCHTGGQVDVDRRDAAGGVVVICHDPFGAVADQRVVAGAAAQQEGHRRGGAGLREIEGIGIPGAKDLVDVVQRIDAVDLGGRRGGAVGKHHAQRAAGILGPGNPGDAADAGTVVDAVALAQRAAFDRVAAEAADDGVVAGAGIDAVVAVAAAQRIAAVAAQQRVVAAAAVQEVVAVAAAEAVFEVGADHAVGEGGADDALDVGQRVGEAPGVARRAGQHRIAADRLGRGREVDEGARRDGADIGRAVVERVEAGAASIRSVPASPASVSSPLLPFSVSLPVLA